MALDKGRGAGVSGLIDFPGVGVQFAVSLSGWAQGGEVAERGRNGRGTGRWAKARRVLSSGNLLCKGTVRTDAFPLPVTFEGVEGQIAIKLSAAQSVTCQIRVLTYKLSLSDPQQGLWDFALTARVTAMPVFTGFGGTQPTYDLPDLDDQELYEGLGKSIDPSDLLSGATQTIDVWGLGDTDDAEGDKIAALIAAAVAPSTGLKLRTAALNPGRDADGATVTLTWGRTSSAEDVVNARTVKNVDPAGIGSAATVAAINDTPDAPTGANFVLRSTSTTTLNDGNTVTADTYGLTTTAEDIENPGTFDRIDPSDLESTGQQTIVDDSAGPTTAATVPAGLQLVATSITVINPDRNKVEYLFAKDTPKQKAEQDATYTLTDPQGLETEAHVAALDTTPSTPSGLYVRGTKAQKLTHDHTLNTIICGVRSTKDDRTMPGTWYEVDPQALDTRGLDTQIFNTGDTAPTVSPAHGTKIVATKTEVIDHVHSQQTVTLGLADSADKVLNPKNISSTDPRLLKGTVDIAVWSDADAPDTPAGYKLVATLDALLPEGKTVRVYRYALNDSKDEAEFERTRTTTDPNDLTSETVLGKVFDTGSPPSDPADPPGQKLVDYFDVPLTAADTSGQSVRVYRWGKLNTIDKLVLPDTVRVVDPNGLQSKESTAAVDDAAPAATIAGLVLRTTKTTAPTPDHVENVAEYGTRSTVDDVEMPETWTDVDPAGIDSRARNGKVFLTAGSVPAAPATPVAGLVVVNERVEAIDQTNSKKVVDYGTLTSAEKVEHQSTSATYDPIDNYEKETATVTACLSSDTEAALAATAFAANQGTSTFAGVTVTKINRFLARTIIRAKNDDKRVTADIQTRREKVLGVAATPASWSASPVAAQVRVARIPVLGGNNTQALVQHVEVDRTRGPVVIRRRQTVTTAAGFAAAANLALCGSLNDAILCGFAAHTLKYSGAKLISDLKLVGAAHLILVEYEFEYDNYCHMNLSKLAYGWVPTASPTTYISVVGDIYPATTYFSADMKITYPPEADMSWAVA